MGDGEGDLSGAGDDRAGDGVRDADEPLPLEDEPLAAGDGVRVDDEPLPLEEELLLPGCGDGDVDGVDGPEGAGLLSLENDEDDVDDDDDDDDDDPELLLLLLLLLLLRAGDGDRVERRWQHTRSLHPVSRLLSF